MKLIVWLGNPGLKYDKTRHNIGFAMIDARAEQEGFLWKQESKYKAEVAIWEKNGEKLLLCKPQTYMNLSGEAVAPLARFYKIEAKDILVVHDEIDFVTGRLALKLGGSAAGHNGLKSIIQKFGSADFYRLRIGVDRPAVSSQVADWVLSSFKPEERALLEQKQGEIFDLIDQFLRG